MRHSDERFFSDLTRALCRLCEVPCARAFMNGQLLGEWTGRHSDSLQLAHCASWEVGQARYELQAFDDSGARFQSDTLRDFEVLAAHARAFCRIQGAANTVSEVADLSQKLLSALDFVTDTFVLLGEDWKILYVNEELVRMVNMPRRAIIGKEVWKTFPQVIGTRFESEVRTAAATNTSRVFEDFAPGLGRWFQVRAFPCEDGLTLLGNDITRRMEADQEREQAQQLQVRSQRMVSLGTLAGAIAHDFNNILSAILGHVGLLRERIGPRSTLRESVDQIGVAGARARDLVQRILAFSRSNSREYTVQPLAPLVEEAVVLLRTGLPPNVTLALQSLGFRCTPR